MLSNVYSTENLKQEIEDAEQTINTTLLDNEKTTGELKEVDERLETGQDFKDGLLNAKHMDIDQELVKLNPLNVKSDITNLEAEKERIETQIKAMVVKEPSPCRKLLTYAAFSIPRGACRYLEIVEASNEKNFGDGTG
jgi:chromosome segregation ATPase